MIIIEKIEKDKNYDKNDRDLKLGLEIKKLFVCLKCHRCYLKPPLGRVILETKIYLLTKKIEDYENFKWI